MSAAWAAAYEAYTCQKAAEVGVLDKRTIDSMSFSPSFVYRLAIDTVDNNCERPIHIYDALEVMKKFGAATIIDYPINCGVRVSEAQKNSASQFRVSGYKRLFDVGEPNKEYVVKKSIAENKPVIIGLYVPSSLPKAEDVDVWTPSPEETSRSYTNVDTAHAMTVVAYDDYQQDGAFEVMNSWGTDWGKGGYIWIKYNDFRTFCFEGYQILVDSILQPKKRESVTRETGMPTFSGSLRFILCDSHAEMRARFRDGVFYMNEPYHTGTRFQVEVHTDEEAYVYALASDRTKRTVDTIFPTANYSANIGRNYTFYVPGPADTNYSSLDNTVGTDYYCLIFSRTQLDLGTTISSIENRTGDFYTAVRDVLGSNLVTNTYFATSESGTILFSCNDTEKTILPVFVELEHIP